MTDSDKRDDFTMQVHKGFFLAQKNAIYLLQKILREQKRGCKFFCVFGK